MAYRLRIAEDGTVESNEGPAVKNTQDHKCSLCLELFTEPKVLPCCHTFCLRCLKKTVKTLGQITCPKCRATHEIPEGGLGEFLTDFVENYAAEVAAIGSSKSRGTVCGECEQPGPVTHFCSDCQNYLCNECGIELHKRLKTYRGHKVSVVSKIDAATLQSCQVQYCSFHRGEALKLYCETCEMLVCRDCTLVKHHQHRYMFIQDAREEVETKLQSLKFKVSKKIASLKSDLDVINRMEFSAQGHSQVLQANINEYFDNLVKGIEAQRTALLQEAEAACEKDLKQVWADKEFHEMCLASISAAFSLTDKALKCTNDSEMILTALQSIKQLSLIMKREWDQSAFVKMVLSCPSFEKEGPITPEAIVGKISVPPGKELEVSIPNSAPHIQSNFYVKVNCKPFKALVDGRSGKGIKLKNVVQSKQLKVKVLYGKLMKELNSDLVTITEFQTQQYHYLGGPLNIPQPDEGSKVFNVNIELVCGGKHTIIFSFGFTEVSHVITVQGKPQGGCYVNKGPDWKEDANTNVMGQNQNQVGMVRQDLMGNFGYIRPMLPHTQPKPEATDVVQVTDNRGGCKNYKWGKDGEYEIELNASTLFAGMNTSPTMFGVGEGFGFTYTF